MNGTVDTREAGEQREMAFNIIITINIRSRSPGHNNSPPSLALRRSRSDDDVKHCHRNVSESIVGCSERQGTYKLPFNRHQSEIDEAASCAAQTNSTLLGASG